MVAGCAAHMWADSGKTPNSYAGIKGFGPCTPNCAPASTLARAVLWAEGPMLRFALLALVAAPRTVAVRSTADDLARVAASVERVLQSSKVFQRVVQEG